MKSSDVGGLWTLARYEVSTAVLYTITAVFAVLFLLTV